MRVNFLSNNDITGGNSGSPVLNGNAELIGLAFDGNWESLSGDILFEPEMQRTISVDIRYVLFIIDKVMNAPHIVKELKLDEKVYKHGFVHSRISFAKNNLITPEAYLGNPDLMKADMNARVPMLSDIYKIYCDRCKQADAMDFDDLLLKTNVLFRNHPDVLQKYQQAFSYILVDEYQDTNFAQYLIVKKLAELHEHICVVGDDAQSIYSFRGANIDNILQFKNSYHNAQIFKLEQNYRSTQTIVNAANSLIDKNAAQIRKNVFRKKKRGNRLKF